MKSTKFFLFVGVMSMVLTFGLVSEEANADPVMDLQNCVNTGIEPGNAVVTAPTQVNPAVSTGDAQVDLEASTDPDASVDPNISVDCSVDAT